MSVLLYLFVAWPSNGKTERYKREKKEEENFSEKSNKENGPNVVIFFVLWIVNMECGYKSRHYDPWFYFLIFIFHFSIAIEKESLNLVANQLKINSVEYTSASYFIAFIRCFILFVCILERFADLLTTDWKRFVFYFV